MSIQELLCTEEKYTCSVLVAGGGIAGVSAALSAARAGADVILVEREYMFGGLATAGLINVYLPLDDGMGHQLSFGIAEELLRLGLQDALMEPTLETLQLWLKPADVATRAQGVRYRLTFNPWIYAIACEKLLLENHVRILYGVHICAVQREGDRITAAIAEGKDGRFAIRAGGYVDATGDADLFAQAGVPTALYEQGNPLAAWYGRSPFHTPSFIKIQGEADVSQEDRLKGMTAQQISNRRYTGMGCENLTEMMIHAHDEIYRDVLRQRTEEPAYQPVCMPVIPQVRMTRRAIGLYDICRADNGKDFEDSVGLFGSWRERGPRYAVPFRCLYSDAAVNLFAAGRCISAADDVWDLTRVIPVCAVTGEAAGAAAAMKWQKPDVAVLQQLLRGRGVPLTMAEAGIG